MPWQNLYASQIYWCGPRGHTLQSLQGCHRTYSPLWHRGYLWKLHLKKYNHLEFSAIKLSYQLPLTTQVVYLPILPCKWRSGRPKLTIEETTSYKKTKILLFSDMVRLYPTPRGGESGSKQPTQTDQPEKNSWKTPLHIPLLLRHE